MFARVSFARLAVVLAAILPVGLANAVPTHSSSRVSAEEGLPDLDQKTSAGPRLSMSGRRVSTAERLLLPDLDQETPGGLRISTTGPRTSPVFHLGFSSAVRNVGSGPLLIEGHRAGGDPTMTADQLIVTADGSLQRVPGVGELRFVRSPSHNHWHLLAFDRYELRAAGSPDVLVKDRKTGFCLGDRYRVSSRVLPNTPSARVLRTNCGLNNTALRTVREGISVGYGDDYNAFLEGQDLPLNGLPAGRYVLVHRVNDEQGLRELSLRNNAASLLLELRWRAGRPSVRVLASCPDRGDCDHQASVRTVATGLEIPWDIAFLPDGSAFVTERPGRVRLLEPGGGLRPSPVATIPVSAKGEGGLLGIALDPSFAQNGEVYLYYTTAMGMKLDRWHWDGSALVRETTLVSAIQAGDVHDSGRIAFGPDGRLYVATGDAGHPALAQDPGSLNGKFLVLRQDQYRGTGPVRPEILALGLRNPQGFDWQPGTGALVANDHGPSGFDGPEGFDEVNLIVPGGNYGWPKAIANATGSGKYLAPLRVYRQPIAPSGAAFLTRPSLWRGSYVLAGLRGQTLRRLELSDGRVVVDEPLLGGRFGRLRTVREGPNGCLYVLTSNRDGRGTPVAADDRVLCVTPPSG
jgi:glucose/arabinose dehydrogenase